VLAAVYRSGIREHVTALPAAARTAASDSITGTYAVGQQLGGAGRGLLAAADHTFVHAMHVAAAGSALVALLGVVVVLAWLPRRSAQYPPVPAPAHQVELVEV